jgi:hypothetical protein
MKDFITRISSRKFLGLILATALLCLKLIDQNIWLVAFGLFIGGNAIEYIKK